MNDRLPSIDELRAALRDVEAEFLSAHQQAVDLRFDDNAKPEDKARANAERDRLEHLMKNRRCELYAVTADLATVPF